MKVTLIIHEEDLLTSVTLVLVVQREDRPKRLSFAVLLTVRSSADGVWMQEIRLVYRALMVDDLVINQAATRQLR